MTCGPLEPGVGIQTTKMEVATEETTKDIDIKIKVRRVGLWTAGDPMPPRRLQRVNGQE